MTGIERLRRLARSQNMDNAWTAMLAHELCDIADQIERETEEQSSRLYDERVGEETGVCGLFGVEPVDDPLTSLRRHVESLNDTIENLRLELGEARDAIAWVREHGGLDAVRRRWECLSYYADPVPRSCMEKRLARLQRQIDESHAALRRRNQRISELNHRACDLTRENAELRKRAMPEGMTWPTVDGKPVDFVTGYEPSLGVLEAVCIYSNGACEVMGHDGIIKGVKEIHVATPKVLDADGAEIRVGDEVWSTGGGMSNIVAEIVDSERVRVKFRDLIYYGKHLTHRAPVLAADGKPLEVGQTVWRIDTGFEYWVKSGQTITVDAVVIIRKTDCDCESEIVKASQLTHRAPVLAADGRPLREGETVWDENGDELVIGALEDGGHTVTCRYVDVGDAIPVHGTWSPSDLTHTKPEPPDTWQRIEEDAGKNPCDYFGFDGEETCGKCPASGKNCEQTMARDLVRRAKKLAGVSE